MLRKLLLGTTAALALTLGGQAFAANTSNSNVTGNDNTVDVDQATRNNDSAVTIINSNRNDVDIDQVNGNTNKSDVGISHSSHDNWVRVDQRNNGDVQATILINEGSNNGTRNDPIAITQINNSSGVNAIIGITGDGNLASIDQRDSRDTDAGVLINGNGNRPFQGEDHTVLQRAVRGGTWAAVWVTGNDNRTSILQRNGSGLTAWQTITGDGNHMLTEQTGNGHFSSETIIGNGNTITVSQSG